MSLVIYIDNNNVVELQGLTNDATDVVDTAATVTVTLKDSAGAEVSGQVWPAAMSLVSESPSTGRYRATLDADLALTSNRRYTAEIDATGSGGEIGHWEICVTAMKRLTC